MRSIFLIIKSRFKRRLLLYSLIIILLSSSIGILNIALALSNGFESGLIRKIISFSPQITILSQKIPDLTKFRQEIKDVFKIKQVQALAINSTKQTSQGIIIKSTKDNSKLIKPSNILAGKYPRNQEILIGSKLARNLDINIGDQLDIITSPASFISFNVSGIFNVGLQDYDSAIAITQDQEVNTLAENSAFAGTTSYYGIWLNNPDRAKTIMHKIISANPDLSATNWQDDNNALVSAISIEKRVIFLILSFLIIVSCLSITITQTILILSQKNQIGILSALGFTPAKLLVLYLFEGLLLSIIGIITGILISIAGCWYLSSYPIPLSSDIYHIQTLPFDLRRADIILVSISTLIIAGLSCIIPAIYASKLSPVEILRN